MADNHWVIVVRGEKGRKWYIDRYTELVASVADADISTSITEAQRKLETVQRDVIAAAEIQFVYIETSSKGGK